MYNIFTTTVMMECVFVRSEPARRGSSIAWKTALAFPPVTEKVLLYSYRVDVIYL